MRKNERLPTPSPSERRQPAGPWLHISCSVSAVAKGRHKASDPKLSCCPLAQQSTRESVNPRTHFPRVLRSLSCGSRTKRHRCIGAIFLQPLENASLRVCRTEFCGAHSIRYAGMDSPPFGPSWGEPCATHYWGEKRPRGGIPFSSSHSGPNGGEFKECSESPWNSSLSLCRMQRLTSKG